MTNTTNYQTGPRAGQARAQTRRARQLIDMLAEREGRAARRRQARDCLESACPGRWCDQRAYEDAARDLEYHLSGRSLAELERLVAEPEPVEVDDRVPVRIDTVRGSTDNTVVAVMVRVADGVEVARSAEWHHTLSHEAEIQLRRGHGWHVHGHCDIAATPTTPERRA